MSCRTQHEASNRGLVAVATLLLDNGAMIDVPGHENETALHDAVNNGRLDCVRLLVSRGASLTLRSALAFVCSVTSTVISFQSIAQSTLSVVVPVIKHGTIC